MKVIPAGILFPLKPLMPVAFGISQADFSFAGVNLTNPPTKKTAVTFFRKLCSYDFIEIKQLGINKLVNVLPALAETKAAFNDCSHNLWHTSITIATLSHVS